MQQGLDSRYMHIFVALGNGHFEYQDGIISL